MTIHDVKQNTPEWFQVRLGKFTASNADTIAANGVGLKTLCFKKVAEIQTGKEEEEVYTNPDIERGREREEMGQNVYELETGTPVVQVGFVSSSERVGCSPDGLIGEDGLLEIKSKNDANFVKYRYEKKIETKYVWQMQMQMLVTDRQWCDYVVFNPNFEKQIIVVRVERDEVAIEKLRLGLEEGQEMVDDILSKI